ncbi:tetratricopeptide repeat protein [Actinomadura sp. NBRC 104425]|uniref:tetratricopeptide repeat protein n=1 Tax=Actinomadura sp. NBRC 104425 TaxID=3032204 RepID=UPI00255271ED|nr:tetratricopeptide repeat protein [Actinomadura sp. NBRC 104425]
MSVEGPGRPDDSPQDAPGDDPGGPDGGVYEWYTRGLRLLKSGSAAAALQLLSRAAEAEPSSRSIREALARAQFGARRYGDAADSFRCIVEADPAEDYALFGLGLSLSRLGDFEGAVEYLALAVAMRPDNRDYANALRHARATLASRR